MEYHKRLAQLRIQNGLTQKQVADMMVANGNAISNATLSKWEQGQRIPDMADFLALCKIYKVDDIGQTFTGDSGMNDDLLNGLNYVGRQHARKLIDLLRDDAMFSATVQPRVQHRYLKLYDLPASAGTGVYFDGDSYEEIMVDDTVPETAEFAVRVSGDSMNPRFIDGQVVFVRSQEYLGIGDIGIFALDSEVYIKKWGGNSLISLNSNYKPIKLKEWNAFRICGKVLG